jgi:hypothetical protein
MLEKVVSKHVAPHPELRPVQELFGRTVHAHDDGRLHFIHGLRHRPTGAARCLWCPQLYSPRLMFCSLMALMVGCSLRVISEIPPYEVDSQAAWHLLPVSAVIELLAVSLFAINLVITFLQPPAHLQNTTR